MNRKGLELLKQVESINDDLKLLLSKKDLPDEFRRFLTLYKVGGQSIHFEKIVLDDMATDQYLLTAPAMYNAVIINGEEYTASIDHIFPYEQLIEELDKYKAQVEHWNKAGFVQIGLMYYGDVLLLGMEGEKRDQIWRYGQGLIKTTMSKLENNIFDFFKRLSESLLEEDIESWGIKKSQIYKNLVEDFWRVKK